nr:hypothetical protein [Streptomyces sp. S1D4-11]QIY96549.1 hypothetical protein HEP87_24195 [Streptomyces sp. S1D4-11]
MITNRTSHDHAEAPRLDRIDLRCVAVTADAMHTQRAHAEYVIVVGGQLPSVHMYLRLS